jgi:hypothetical protein
MAIAQRAGAAVAQSNAALATIATAGFNCQTNDIIVVAVAIRTNTSTVKTDGTGITDTIGNSYTAAKSLTLNNTNCRIEVWWVTSTGANATNAITVTLSANSKFEVAAESYSGVLALGNTGTNSGNSVSPALTLTMQDTNNWIAMGCVGQGTNAITATSPNVVRQSGVTTGGAAGTNVGGAEGDAGAFATAGSQTVTFAIAGGEFWATAGIELRSVAAAAAVIAQINHDIYRGVEQL